MAAYNPGGSLVWAAVLDVTGFHRGIQSMTAQIVYAERAASGLESSLKSVATVAFAGLIVGIGGITAAIAISTKAAAEWETQMLDVAQLADINIKTPKGLQDYNKLSRELLNTYADIPIKEADLFTAVKPYAAANYTGETLSNLTETTAKWHETSRVATDDISNMIIALAAINPGAVEAAGGIDVWADKVLSSMSRAANDAKITSDEVVSGITQSAGSLNKWNLQNQIPEQIALLTTMSQFGLDFGSWKTTLSSAVSGPGLTGPSSLTPELSKSLASAGINLPYENLVKSVSAKGKVSIKSEKVAYKGYDIAAAIMGYEDADAFMDAYEKDAPTLMLNTISTLKSLGLPTLRENELYGLIFGERAARELPKMGGANAVEYYGDMVKKVSDAYKEGTLATELYEIKQSGLEAQWNIMTNRGHAIKTLLGDMFKGPVKDQVAKFSDSLRGTVTWLEGITDAATLPSGALDSWKAIGMVIDGLKSKIPDNLFKYTVTLVGAAAVLSNLGTIKTVALGAADAILKIAGVSLAPIVAPLAGIVSGLGTVTLAAAGVALGLAAIGYSLAPEKFTYFNQVASEALTGVRTVVGQLISDLSAGDWGAAANHLQAAFQSTIAWLQGIDWGRLGNEIVTMIGDGANAVVGTALNIGGWIYDNLTGWATGGGPRKLGESIGTFIGEGISTISTMDWGQYIEDAINTVSDWGELGWEIISQIGSGFYNGVAGSLTPAANTMVQVLTKAALDIYVVFSKTWNTIIVLAASAASAISGAFSSVGTTIAGYLQPAIDAVKSLSDISLPNIGNVGSSINPIVKYYNSDSGVSMTPEQYNMQRATGKKPKGFSPVRMWDSANNISTNIGNTFDVINNSDTLNTDFDRSKITQPPYGSTIVLDYKDWPGSSVPGIPILNPADYNLNMAGYRTGGKGFVIEEMKPAGKDSSYLITDLGEKITFLDDDFKVSNDTMKQILPYLIDYPTNTEEMSKDYANSIFPITNNIKEASDYSRKTSTDTNNATRETANYTNNATKEAALYSSEKVITAADFANANARRTALETNQITKAGVAESYGPVRVGLTDSGNKIALIGSVAQQQFAESGNKWVGDTKQSGFSFFTDSTNGGKNVEAGGTNAGNSLNNGASAINAAAAKLQNLEIMFGGGTVTNKIGDTSGAKYGEVIKGRTLGEYIKELQGSKTLVGTGSNAAPDTLNVDNFEDMTCMGDRVMVNALKYTPPGGETTSYNPMDSEAIRNADTLEGTFQDMTCIGTTVNLPGLKYTNPYGNTSYINPSEYIAGGGVMNYQQTAAKEAGDITVNSAKKGAEYTTNAAANYMSISEFVNANNLSSSQYVRDMEFVAAVENGNMWRNDLAFAGTAFAAPVNESTFNFAKVGDDSVKQAYDYLGAQMTVNDKEYIQAKERLEKDKAVIDSLTGASNALSGAASQIESAGSNFVGSVSNAMSSFGGGWYGSMGGFGGTSKGGGGAWVGTYPTPSWSGPAISDYVRTHPSGTGWKGSSFSWGAKGSLIDEPSRIIAGEKGRELLLPNYLTELFLKLAAVGFNSSNGGDGNIITIVNIDGEQVEKVVSKRQKRNLNLRGLKLH